MTVEDFSEVTLRRQRVANDAMYAGDPEPFMAMWSRSEDVSLFGAFGPCKTGWPALSEVFRWVGGRFSNGAMRTEFEVVHAGTELAYTVGYERGELSVDGGPVGPVAIRVTQMYRAEEGQWRLIHRHGDFAPVDESPGR
ncbi:nuclear transport factor 2 family protein [Streptomyces vinaceus]|uniref:Nuclear transport factor 2 family protein n=1 Tax=Streptomyces vinaceus TaxID=1960 RepID=A0A5J6JI94_STRVI|nr:nuclear transport factor 2 family protein [Streptomyces vinaceus]QEV49422.1 nuclear transport factor 2 family protein [Streptomyces vinaceus]GHE45352.1 hypothetical protein GCM10017778_31260 [Streptomyces vinaceus]